MLEKFSKDVQNMQKLLRATVVYQITPWLKLYQGVPCLIPCSPSLLDETSLVLRNKKPQTINPPSSVLVNAKEPPKYIFKKKRYLFSNRTKHFSWSMHNTLHFILIICTYSVYFKPCGVWFIFCFSFQIIYAYWELNLHLFLAVYFWSIFGAYPKYSSR